MIGAHFSMLSSAGFATHASLIHRFELKVSSAKAVTSTIMVVVYSALRPAVELRDARISGHSRLQAATALQSNCSTSTSATSQLQLSGGRLTPSVDLE